jgi:hypothetical protein
MENVLEAYLTQFIGRIADITLLAEHESMEKLMVKIGQVRGFADAFLLSYLTDSSVYIRIAKLVFQAYFHTEQVEL